jgi:hypothetical protein
MKNLISFILIMNINFSVLADVSSPPKANLPSAPVPESNTLSENTQEKRECQSCKYLDGILLSTAIFSGLEYGLYKKYSFGKSTHTFSLIKTYWSVQCSKDLYAAVEDRFHKINDMRNKYQNNLGNPNQFVDDAWSDFKAHRAAALSPELTWSNHYIPALVKDKVSDNGGGSVGDLTEMLLKTHLTGSPSTSEDHWRAAKGFLCDAEVQKLVQTRISKRPSPMMLLIPLNGGLDTFKSKAEKFDLYTGTLQKASADFLPAVELLGVQLGTVLTGNIAEWTGHQIGMAADIQKLAADLMAATNGYGKQKPNLKEIKGLMEDIIKKTKNFNPDDPMYRYGLMLQEMYNKMLIENQISNHQLPTAPNNSGVNPGSVNKDDLKIEIEPIPVINKPVFLLKNTNDWSVEQSEAAKQINIMANKLTKETNKDLDLQNTDLIKELMEDIIKQSKSFDDDDPIFQYGLMIKNMYDTIINNEEERLAELIGNISDEDTCVKNSDLKNIMIFCGKNKKQ